MREVVSDRGQLPVRARKVPYILRVVRLRLYVGQCTVHLTARALDLTRLPVDSAVCRT